jgi:hypothetical protein
VKQLDVDEMRRMEVSILGYSLDEPPASRATIASSTAEVSTTSTGQERSRPDPGRKAAPGCDISRARNSRG